MTRFVMFTQPAQGLRSAQPLVINIDRIESIAPRMIVCEEDRLKIMSEKRWIEEGTWITMNGSEEGTFHVVQTFDMVMKKLGFFGGVVSS